MTHSEIKYMYISCNINDRMKNIYLREGFPLGFWRLLREGSIIYSDLLTWPLLCDLGCVVRTGGSRSPSGRGRITEHHLKICSRRKVVYELSEQLIKICKNRKMSFITCSQIKMELLARKCVFIGWTVFFFIKLSSKLMRKPKIECNHVHNSHLEYFYCIMLSATIRLSGEFVIVPCQ